MLFNSFEYLIFFPVVFTIYWLLGTRNFRVQNIFLILTGYIFYGWWDWRFLGLIIFSSLSDFLIAVEIDKSDNPVVRKRYLLLSCFFNLGVLIFFKYFNFFKENFEQIFSTFGFKTDFITLDIILPVGISFYTFQTLSYTIDVYRRDISPIKDASVFFCYVSFFPQLVAGPIERAKNLLHQFNKKRFFDYKQGKDGCRQILLGFFKKVVIADNSAYFINPVFDNCENYDSTSLITAAILFSFQIYGDFSGYSDIAIGTSKLFGINLKQNFNYPYFARDIAEFWRRWHISLSGWFKDYLYIPLGGSKKGKLTGLRNIFIIFLVSGFWHGANWTFVFWGLLNAIYFIPGFLFGTNRQYLTSISSGLPNIKELAHIMSTFTLVTTAWVLFRSDSLTSAFDYYSAILFTEGQKQLWNADLFNYRSFRFIGLISAILTILLFEWKNKNEPYGFRLIHKSVVVRTCIYLLMTQAIIKNFFSDQPFIYFQF